MSVEEKEKRVNKYNYSGLNDDALSSDDNAEEEFVEAVDIVKFKIENIIGMLHVNEFSYDDSKFTFSWDYAEDWTSKPNKRRFLGGERTSVRNDNIGLKDAFLVCWNRGRGTIEYDLDEKRALRGEIVFDDWSLRLQSH